MLNSQDRETETSRHTPGGRTARQRDRVSHGGTSWPVLVSYLYLSLSESTYFSRVAAKRPTLAGLVPIYSREHLSRFDPQSTPTLEFLVAAARRPRADPPARARARIPAAARLCGVRGPPAGVPRWPARSFACVRRVPVRVVCAVSSVVWCVCVCVRLWAVV